MNILILSDFVGCGNVAMGVARSVLTHMGHNALCLPTALISNTWNLGAPAVLDTTAYLQEALAAWERLGIQPEGVLLGYLADEAQTVFIEEQCRRWREKGIKIFLDPIFADNGKLYRGITAARIAFLKRLLPHIDYVLLLPVFRRKCRFPDILSQFLCSFSYLSYIQFLQTMRTG